MLDFILENNTITKNQSAFRKLHSTIESLLSSTDYWCENIDGKKLNITIFRDGRLRNNEKNYAFLVQMTINSPMLHLHSVVDSYREHDAHHIAWTGEKIFKFF